MIYLIYPERRTVTETQVIGWANDAFANEEVSEVPRDMDHAIWMLEDAGLITVQSRSAAL